jgi:glutamine synthetase
LRASPDCFNHEGSAYRCPFLLRSDVFNENFIANWIDMKQKEYDALRLRPHPYEFAMYYDV